MTRRLAVSTPTASKDIPNCSSWGSFMTKAKVIDGKAFSENLVARVAVEAKTLAAKIGRPPALAVVLVGEDPASAVYVLSLIHI